MPEETDKTSIAIINTNITYIQRDINDIKISVDKLAGVYATNKDLEEIARQTEKRFIALENKNNLWQWLTPTLSAVIAVIIEFLFVSYIQHYK